MPYTFGLIDRVLEVCTSTTKAYMVEMIDAGGDENLISA